MTRHFLCAGLLITAAGMANAQTKAPKPKSADEVKAIQAMYGATTPDDQIAAANALIEKFADTEFKSIAFQLMAEDYQRKNDFAKTIVYGERALEADPKNYQADLILANEYSRGTHDTDFDKDDKLKKAEKYAHDTITNVADAPKPNTNIDDAKWAGIKKDIAASAHEALGLVAMDRKDNPGALAEFKTATETAADPDPATYARLAMADNLNGKYDDAIAAADKALSLPDAAPQVKQFAQAEKARATMNKNKGSAATTPAPASAAPATPSSATPATPPPAPHP